MAQLINHLAASRKASPRNEVVDRLAESLQTQVCAAVYVQLSLRRRHVSPESSGSHIFTRACMQAAGESRALGEIGLGRVDFSERCIRLSLATSAFRVEVHLDTRARSVPQKLAPSYFESMHKA
jgi:hypothetical protein